MRFHTGTALARGLRDLLEKLQEHLQLRAPLRVYLAGGMAVHLYTGSRVTTDVDAEYSARIMIPDDLVVEVQLEDGSREVLFPDTNYNSSFALMHEDYQDDALPLDLGLAFIDLRVLSPVDLAVSKIARFAEVDQEDIDALVRLGLTDANAIARRADEAIGGFIGTVALLRHNLRDALEIARRAEASRLPAT
ncbi:MAG: hypothetical protein HYZ17_04130 [Betaproteobacteria bacterium]|nr:hypothetical protein [Betaproteobacteria bacterium]